MVADTNLAALFMKTRRDNIPKKCLGTEWIAGWAALLVGAASVLIRTAVPQFFLDHGATIRFVVVGITGQEA